MSLPKHPFDVTLLSCLSCPNLATTFSRQNWQSPAGKEKFGSRCCLQYTVQHGLFLPSSHFLLFWSKVVLLYYTTTTTLYTMKQTDGHPKSLMCSTLSRDKIEHTNYLGSPRSPFHIINIAYYVLYVELSVLSVVVFRILARYQTCQEIYQLKIYFMKFQYASVCHVMY